MKKILYHGSEFLIEKLEFGKRVPDTMITEEVFIVQKI